MSDRSSSPPRIPTPPLNYRIEEREKPETIGELTIRKLIENCHFIDKRFDSELKKLTDLKRSEINRLTKLFPVDELACVKSHLVWMRLFADRLLVGFSLNFTDRKIKVIDAVILVCNEKPDLKYTVDTFESGADSIVLLLNFKLNEFLNDSQNVYTLSGFVECDRKQIEIERFQIESKQLIQPHYKLKTDRVVHGQEDFYALLAALPNRSDFPKPFFLIDSREPVTKLLQAIKNRNEKSNLFYLYDNCDPNDLVLIEIERENRTVLSLRTNNQQKFQLLMDQNEDFMRIFRRLPVRNRPILQSFVQITDRLEQYLDGCPIVDDRVLVSHNRNAYRKFLHDLVNDQLEIDEEEHGGSK